MPLKKQDRLSGLQENPQDEMLADDSDIFKNINPNLTLEIGLVGDTNYTPCKNKEKFYINVTIYILEVDVLL
jgi:hypothetical protein